VARNSVIKQRSVIVILSGEFVAERLSSVPSAEEKFEPFYHRHVLFKIFLVSLKAPLHCNLFSAKKSSVKGWGVSWDPLYICAVT